MEITWKSNKEEASVIVESQKGRKKFSTIHEKLIRRRPQFFRSHKQSNCHSWLESKKFDWNLNNKWSQLAGSSSSNDDNNDSNDNGKKNENKWRSLFVCRSKYPFNSDDCFCPITDFCFSILRSREITIFNETSKKQRRLKWWNNCKFISN